MFKAHGRGAEGESVATLVSLGAAALRPAVGVGRRVDRRARDALAAPARRATLAAVDAALAALDAALTSPLAEEVGERIRASALPDALEPLVGRLLDSPDAERLVRQLVDSRLINGFLRELPENEALWLLIDEIAQSPAVTNAISRQGMSFADQMAGVVRNRSRNADDHLERIARRVARRQSRDSPPADATPAAGE